ncbi:sporulation membrane protein YtrI [Gracilibacillus xinjiangensis]|uniref:Sporulation membrane protein YtrI n=1 Tax=Gracilibacillus xinjiangensis TaxID=1193282 RepID=A0ABV8WZU3_9BACI
MHIPPLYKRPGWQRFLAGSVIGAFIAYFIFVFMYGEMQEKWIEENLALRGELLELKETHNALVENHRILDEQAKEGIEIKEVTITFTNLKTYKIEHDRIMIQQLNEAIKQETSQMIGMNLAEVTNSTDLLIRAIENKTITIDDFKFRAKVKKMIVTETLQLSIELSKGN